MASSYLRLPMARRYHEMPMMRFGTDDQGDLSGLRGTDCPARHVPLLEHDLTQGKKPNLKAPDKRRAFESTNRMYPTTPPPPASEEGLDGPGRGAVGKIKAQRQKRSR